MLLDTGHSTDQSFTTSVLFQVHFYPRSCVWELRILAVDWSDAGQYSCKTNTSPARYELVQLRVKDTVAVISGPKEMILKEGSRLLLHCVVELGRGPDRHFRESAVMYWFVNQRLIDPEAGREVGGVKTRTRLGKKLQGWLSISATTPQHSGNYSCVPSYTTPDWVVVHVIPGNITLPFLHYTRLGGGACHTR